MEFVKYTPGPWYPHWNGHYFTIDVGPDENDPSVAHVNINHVLSIIKDEAEANAALIAAAPELLDALREFRSMKCETDGVEDIESGCCRTCRARSAIVKAGGRL